MYPAYDVTPAISKRKKKSSDEDLDVDLADTFMSHGFEKAVAEGEDEASEVGKEADKQEEAANMINYPLKIR